MAQISTVLARAPLMVRPLLGEGERRVEIEFVDQQARPQPSSAKRVSMLSRRATMIFVGQAGLTDVGAWSKKACSCAISASDGAVIGTRAAIQRDRVAVLKVVQPAAGDLLLRLWDRRQHGWARGCGIEVVARGWRTEAVRERRARVTDVVRPRTVVLKPSRAVGSGSGWAGRSATPRLPEIRRPPGSPRRWATGSGGRARAGVGVAGRGVSDSTGPGVRKESQT